jgi:hypothetical protein
LRYHLGSAFRHSSCGQSCEETNLDSIRIDFDRKPGFRAQADANQDGMLSKDEFQTGCAKGLIKNPDQK